MSAPRPRAGVLDITPYVGSEARPGGGHVINIGSNESALGASPRAVAAYEAAAGELHRYPEIDARSLRDAIGAHHGLDPARIVCGAGSDDLLGLIAGAYAGPGDEVIHTAHSFMMYPIITRRAGATPVAVPERALTADVDAILAHVTARTRIVFLANPNNPTGTFLDRDALARLHAGLPDEVLLVVDSAYAEYIVRNDYEAGRALVDAHDNVVMARTFSKIYALAALRIGWVYVPPAIADALDRVRPPFNVTQPAIEAGKAALDDIAHVDRSRTVNDTVLPWFSERVTALGLTVNPSVANFVIVRFDATPGRDAVAAYDHLVARGIMARRMGGYGLPDWIRFSIGTDAEMATVADALADFVAP